MLMDQQNRGFIGFFGQAGGVTTVLPLLLSPQACPKSDSVTSASNAILP
ncbi:MAG: hypothetical protein Rpha_1082 [Candidatus Ruthia sp. Apha_13_S6]|nr:hypothetical protein [Candidatus Ruthia sp. Apha_13_S6]